MFFRYFCIVNTVIRHIEYLISRNDCVIVPEFGAFLASYRNARFTEHNTMLPPSRIFSFNNDLRHNDGSLIWSVAKAQGISYQAAASIVDAEVAAMRRQLIAQGELAIGKLGLLRHNNADDITEFEPYDTDRLSVSTAWLPEIEIRPIMKVAKAGAEHSGYISHKPKSFARIWRVAASFTILLGICFVASTPLSVDDAALASLSPKIEHIEPEQIIPTLPDPAPISIIKLTTDDLYTTVDTAARNQYRTSRRIVKANDNAGAHPYCVVVSSHASLSEANRYIKMHESDNLDVLEKDGRFRVYAGSYPTLSDARRASQSVTNKYPDAWVCRR